MALTCDDNRQTTPDLALLLPMMAPSLAPRGSLAPLGSRCRQDGSPHLGSQSYLQAPPMPQPAVSTVGPIGQKEVPVGRGMRGLDAGPGGLAPLLECRIRAEGEGAEEALLSLRLAAELEPYMLPYLPLARRCQA